MRFRFFHKWMLHVPEHCLCIHKLFLFRRLHALLPLQCSKLGTNVGRNGQCICHACVCFRYLQNIQLKGTAFYKDAHIVGAFRQGINHQTSLARQAFCNKEIVIQRVAVYQNCKFCMNCSTNYSNAGSFKVAGKLSALLCFH